MTITGIASWRRSNSTAEHFLCAAAKWKRWKGRGKSNAARNSALPSLSFLEFSFYKPGRRVLRRFALLNCELNRLQP